MIVRYVGSAPASILDTPYRFTAYGQIVNMPDDKFALARAGRIHLITESQYKSLGHTPDEEKRYGRFESHAGASPEFLAKVREAWRMCQEDPNHGSDRSEPVQVEPVTVEVTTIKEDNDA